MPPTSAPRSTNSFNCWSEAGEVVCVQIGRCRWRWRPRRFCRAGCWPRRHDDADAARKGGGCEKARCEEDRRQAVGNKAVVKAPAAKSGPRKAAGTSCRPQPDGHGAAFGPASPPADHSEMDHSQMDQGQMDMGPEPSATTAPVDHSQMDMGHGAPGGHDGDARRARRLWPRRARPRAPPGSPTRRAMAACMSWPATGC